MIKIDKLNPFGRMCLSMGMIPSSYAESLTYEEQLIWFCNFLEKQVIPAINKEGEAIEELQNLYTELKTYVDNYFENLDVQEEINNKLDDMAESGELADIIAQYLQLAGVLAYNSISDMSHAENITEGSICYTLGQTTYNDGKGAFYKIRTITSGDVVDGFNIVALDVSDTLIAERLSSYYINFLNKTVDIESNPIYYGADPKGTEDSTTAINNCILANKGKTINLTTGTYLINDTINLPFANDEKVSINGNGATLICSEELTNLFNIGYDRDEANNDVGTTSYIKDLFINCEDGDVTNIFFVNNGYKDLKLINITTYRSTNALVIGDSTSSPGDVLVDNCLFYGNGSEYEGVGIIAYNSDNNFNNTRIYGFRKGFDLYSLNNILKCHVLLRWHDQTGANFDPYERNSETFNTYYEQTKFAEVRSSALIENCYCDSTYQFLQIYSDKAVILNNSLYYNSRNNCDCNLFKITNVSSRFTLTNNILSISKNTIGQVFDKNSVLLANYSNVNIKNNLIWNESNLTNECDLILSDVPTVHNAINMSANTWYLIKVIGNVPENNTMGFDLFINGYRYFIRCGMSGNTMTINQQNNGTGDSNWTLGFLKIDNNVYICLKPTTDINGVKFNINMIYTNNTAYALTPSKNAYITECNRLLSNFTNQTPSATLLMKNVLF